MSNQPARVNRRRGSRVTRRLAHSLSLAVLMFLFTFVGRASAVEVSTREPKPGAQTLLFTLNEVDAAQPPCLSTTLSMRANGGRPVTLVLTATCVWNAETSRGRGFQLYSSASALQSHPSAEFVPEWETGGYDYLQYAVSTDGKSLAQDTIKVDTSPETTRRIYQGSDDFVNICINGSHEVRSLNHRLYCDVTQAASYTISQHAALTLTTGEARQLAELVLFDRFKVLSVFAHCSPVSMTRANCRVNFTASRLRWKGTVQIWVAFVDGGVESYYSSDVRGYPRGCHRSRCSRHVAVHGRGT